MLERHRTSELSDPSPSLYGCGKGGPERGQDLPKAMRARTKTQVPDSLHHVLWWHDEALSHHVSHIRHCESSKGKPDRLTVTVPACCLSHCSLLTPGTTAHASGTFRTGKKIEAWGRNSQPRQEAPSALSWSTKANFQYDSLKLNWRSGGEWLKNTWVSVVDTRHKIAQVFENIIGMSKSPESFPTKCIPFPVFAMDKNN